MTPEKIRALIGSAPMAPVVDKITAAVAATLVTHPYRGKVGAAAVKERFDVVWGILVRLTGDHGWSLLRALDHAAPFARLQLDGLSWEPSKRTVWLAGDLPPAVPPRSSVPTSPATSC